MKKFALLLIVLLISGCSTAPKTEALIPIHAPCKAEMPAEPTYRYNPPYDNIFDAVKDLIGDKKMAESHTTELTAALKACK